VSGRAPESRGRPGARLDRREDSVTHREGVASALARPVTVAQTRRVRTAPEPPAEAQLRATVESATTGDPRERAHDPAKGAMWPYLLPLLAAAGAGALALRWILHAPHWQTQPWALWLIGTGLVLGVAGGLSAFVSAIGVVVAFERDSLRRERAA